MMRAILVPKSPKIGGSESSYVPTCLDDTTKAVVGPESGSTVAPARKHMHVRARYGR